VPQSNGIGKSIANFFKNIGHSKEGSRPSSPSDRTVSKQRLTSSSTSQFPPILLDAGPLQADGSKKSPSPQPGDKRPFVSPNPETSSSYDELLAPAILKARQELLSKPLDELKYVSQMLNFNFSIFYLTDFCEPVYMYV